MTQRPSRAFGWSLVVFALGGFIVVPFLLWDATFFELSRSWLGSTHGRSAIAAIVVALLAADVVLPTPSSFVSAGAVAALGPALGALTVWCGMSAGAFAGYALGRSGGKPFVERVVDGAELGRAERSMRRFGSGVLVLCRGVPVLAEASVLLAGATGMPFGRFAWVTGAANLGLALAYAFLSRTGSHGWLALLTPFALGILVPALAIAALRGSERRG